MTFQMRFAMSSFKKLSKKKDKLYKARDKIGKKIAAIDKEILNLQENCKEHEFIDMQPDNIMYDDFQCIKCGKNEFYPQY